MAEYACIMAEYACIMGEYACIMGCGGQGGGLPASNNCEGMHVSYVWHAMSEWEGLSSQYWPHGPRGSHIIVMVAAAAGKLSECERMRPTCALGMAVDAWNFPLHICQWDEGAVCAVGLCPVIMNKCGARGTTLLGLCSQFCRLLCIYL